MVRVLPWALVMVTPSAATRSVWDSPASLSSTRWVIPSSWISMELDSPLISLDTSRRICSAVLVMRELVRENFRLNSWVMGPQDGYSSSSSDSPGAAIPVYPLPSSLSREMTEYTPPAVTPSPSSAAGSSAASSALNIWYWQPLTWASMASAMAWVAWGQSAASSAPVPSPAVTLFSSSSSSVTREMGRCLP